MRILFILLNIFFINICLSQAQLIDLVKYVNPLIGTANDGNVFPGVTLPFGMVKLGPDGGERMQNAGFSLNNIEPISGFSHLHVSGTGGGPKYGNILVMPFTGNYKGNSVLSKWQDIKTIPGYFSIMLSDYKIKVELTATHSAGFHQYTFPESDSANIVIDVGSYLGRYFCCGENQKLVTSEILVNDDNSIQGVSVIMGGWNMGKAYSVYFYAIPDTKPFSYEILRNDSCVGHKKLTPERNDSVRVVMHFKTKKDQKIKLKIGISFINIAKAKQNVEKEIPDWNFEKTADNAREIWNQQLSVIKIEGDDELKKIFYTALYHSLLMPSDRTGENPDWKSSEPYYDDYYAIWDTYRTLNPLLNIILPSRNRDMIRSLIDIYEHEGYMPDARSGNDNGRTQGGSDCDIMIADAYMKGITGIDYEKALKAMIKNAEVPPGGNERKHGRGGINDYNNLGFVSTSYERSGNRTVEYTYCDYSISQVAKGLGKIKEYDLYNKRSNNWQNLWRPINDHGAKGFIMPRHKDGSWVDTCMQWRWDKWKSLNLPFTVFSSGTWPDVFYEANSWIYSLNIPHNVKKLIDTCGGKEKFIARLDTLFKNNYYDVTNEPSFLLPCLYNYVGRPDKTAEIIRKTIAKNFNSSTKGLPGNDDSGAMSSWLIFHVLGFYPNAGQDVYLIASPLVNKAVININENKQLFITVKSQSNKNIYVKSVLLNGKPLQRNWFRHSEIKDGGTLEFIMDDKPSAWGTTDLPPSMSDIIEKK